MKKICIIPARGGSKRIPRKNIRLFFGKPVIGYAIQAALESVLFDEVMVSTDDEEISAVAQEMGASVPFLRSPETAGDFANTFDVLKEVLEKYQAGGHFFDAGCCLYPVAPLTTKKHLSSGYEKLLAGGFDTVLPVVPFSVPIWRGLRVENDHLTWIWPAYATTRSQDLEKVYHDAGQWYWFRTQILLEKGQLISSNSGHVELDEMLVQDVDEESDWQLLELKYRMLHGDHK